MNRRVPVLLLAVVLLASLSGCGTRSILVPVTRHADIDLRNADTLLVLPTRASTSTSFTRAIAGQVDSLLPVTLSGHIGSVRLARPTSGAPSIFAAGGSVSRRSLRWWKDHAPGELLLHVAIADGRLIEEVAAAEIQSTRAPGSVKYVRQGRAEAHTRIVLVDARRELLLFDDTLHVYARDETHATDAEPPPLDADRFAFALAQDVARRIAEAAHPVSDRDVVTFLVDKDFPEIEAAVTYAEAGRWKQAAAVLRRLVAEKESHEDADIIWYDLGLVLQYDEQFKDALAAFDRALALRDKGRYRQARAELLRREDAYLDRLERGRE